MNTSNQNKNSAALYLRLLTYVRPYWKQLTISVIVLALLAATEPLFPALMKPLIDDGFTKRDAVIINWIPPILVLLFLVRGALSFAASYVSAWVSNRVVADIRKQMFDHALALPTTFYDSTSSGKISSYITYNVGAVTGAATQALTVITRDSLAVIGLMSWLLWLDWKLTSITIAMIPLIYVVVKYFNKRLRRVSSNSQHAMAAMTHKVEEAASNNRIVKIFNARAIENRKFKAINDQFRQFSMKETVAASAIGPTVQLLTSLSVAIIISVALMENETQRSAGEFMSFLTALLMLLPPIKRLTDITATIQRGLAASEIIFGLLDEKTEILDHKQDIDVLQGDVEFIDVSYAYPNGTTAINGINLKIPKGKVYALVGKSGSGKSTIANLLCSFMTPSSGAIQVDGLNIKKITLDSLRRNIAYVSQDVRLFDDTILANVSYGDTTPDIKKALNSLKQANAIEFIDKMPNGLETQVGQNGIKLSGGQRQRIAIARAFYKDSPILILDEATSALDTESERHVQNAIENLTRNRTCIVIAHRLSTIAKSDQIIVINHGSVAESGSHKELLEKNGEYTKLYFAHENTGVIA